MILERFPGSKLPARPIRFDRPIFFKRLAIGIYSPNGTKCCLSNIALKSPCSFISTNEFLDLLFSLRTIPKITDALEPAVFEISSIMTSLSFSNLDIAVSGQITTLGDLVFLDPVKSNCLW